MREKKKRAAIKGTELTEEEIAHAEGAARKLWFYFETGERYINKEKTIQEWMEADRKKDEFYESAEAPENIRCLTCRNRVTPTFKEFWYENGKSDRILFM